MKIGRGGTALIIVLMAVSIVTALTIEFVSIVFTSTSSLKNWKSSQKLSMVSTTAVELTARLVRDNLKNFNYTYPAGIDFPPQNPYLESDIIVSVRVEDESSKINLNKMEINYDKLKRLFAYLGINRDELDRIADWIDKDEIPKTSASENEAKNGSLDSLEEILEIRGMDTAVYDKLKPYVTVYGDHLVNINGASLPIIMSLDEEMTEELAQKIISYRESSPFQSISDLQKVSGLGTIGISLQSNVKVKGSAFSIVSTASEDKLKRIVRCVIDPEGNIKYWQEI